MKYIYVNFFFGIYRKNKKIPLEEKSGPFMTAVSGNDVTMVYENDKTSNTLNGFSDVAKIVEVNCMTDHVPAEEGYENMTFVQDNAIYTKL